MEPTHRNSERWSWKTLVFLLLGLLFTTGAEAQMASASVSPSSISVSNGDTVTITATGYVTLGVLSSAGWSYSGRSWPTNAVYTTTGGGILNVDSTITSTLTISHITSASAGTYTFSVSGGLLLIVSARASATVGIIPTVTADPVGSHMVEKGFKILFSGPTGSNLVIQASSDMKNWTSLCTNVITSGSVTYTDAVAKAVTCRFYRGRLK
jgi:hypothetical protein